MSVDSSTLDAGQQSVWIHQHVQVPRVFRRAHACEYTQYAHVRACAHGLACMSWRMHANMRAHEHKRVHMCGTDTCTCWHAWGMHASKNAVTKCVHACLRARECMCTWYIHALTFRGTHVHARTYARARSQTNACVCMRHGSTPPWGCTFVLPTHRTTHAHPHAHS